MKSKLFKIIVFALFLLISTNSLSAATIFESATMGPTNQGGGFSISFDQFLSCRFYIDKDIYVTAIGGHLFSSSGSNIFGAIVSLNSSTDLPKGSPFSASEVVATTLFTPPYSSMDFRTPMSVKLSPGYYALVFGAGQFGSPQSAWAAMPYEGQTNLPGSSYLTWKDLGWEDNWFGQKRFVIEGDTSPSCCPASGGCDEYISKVVVGTINNSSACGSYQDFNSLSTTMSRGTAYPITITNGKPYSTDICGIWIDWNHDFDFTDAGEAITMTNGSGVGPYTATITPPVTASIGNTRMRIRIQYGGTLSPCDTTTYGEVEDYNIIVTELVSTINISGCVKTADGVRLKGIKVNASPNQGPPQWTTTDSLGQYNLNLPSPFTGGIGASQTDWSFTMGSFYVLLSTDLEDQNFIGTYNITYQGNGTTNNPYLIYNAAQLNAIGARAYDWYYHFKLMSDIDLSGYDGKDGRPAFNRIGYYINFGDTKPFGGVFDGGGHTISNFTFDCNFEDEAVGLFGYLYFNQGLIKNVKMANVDVNSNSWIGTGALVGMSVFGTVAGCSVNGGKVSADSEAGSLIGFALEGTTINCDAANVNVSGNDSIGGLIGISNNNLFDCNASCVVTGHTECGGLVGNYSQRKAVRCKSSGTVSLNYVDIGDESAGGLMGVNYGFIEQCSSSATVTGGSCGEIGGLVGRNMEYISNSFATGSVSGYQEIGGLAGMCWDANIINCYSTGHINATTSNLSYKGGLNGYLIGTNNIIGSFWDTQTSGITTSNGGTAKNSTEMKTQNTFTEAGWDFADRFIIGDEEIWSMSPGNYPRLSWQNEKYGAGSGIPDDPYLIFTHKHLYNIGNDTNDCNKCFRMMADIDLSSYSDNQFHLIGTDVNPFTGIFDGNDYNISNFTYYSIGIDYVGLFRTISGLNTVVKKIGLVNPDINAGSGDYVGGLTGMVKNQAAINNCFVNGGTVKGTLYVGGLIGSDSNKPSINDSYSTSAVYGTTGTGGLEGYHASGTIAGCYSSGGVTGTTENSGGLIGMSTGAAVHNSYSISYINGANKVGGLIGLSDVSTIVNCYSTGHVYGLSYRGGLIGYNPNIRTANTVLNSFWDIQNSGVATSVDGTGLTTAQMQDVNTFLNAGWDFVDQPDGPGDIWAMPTTSGYPILWWQLNPWPDLPEFSGGSGIETDPYIISTPEELASIGYNPRLMTSYFKLNNDIDMQGVDFYSIGNRWYSFLGSFDGQGHTISNLYLDSNDIDYVGLFGRVYGTGMTIQNVGLINPEINGGEIGTYIGALAGYIGKNITVSNCYAQNTLVTGNTFVGGLIGLNGGKINRCYTEGSVTGYSGAGLISGVNTGTIIECHSEGISSGHGTVGNLVGLNTSGGEIYRCRANGTNTATGNVSGGLIGSNLSGGVFDSYSEGQATADLGAGGLIGSCSNSLVVNCYSICSVNGNGYVGGLIGSGSSSNTITCSFWDVNVTNEPCSAGGEGKTTTEMRKMSTFTNAGWDFVGETINGPNDFWTIRESLDYPRLYWEPVIPVTDITIQIDLDHTWMYQNLPGKTDSKIIATINESSFYDPLGNSNYYFYWVIEFPHDVSSLPITVSGGSFEDTFWTLASRGCDVPTGISDSGQTFKIKLTIEGADYGNIGRAEKEFGIALLGDTNNNGVVNIADLSIINTFWRTGSAGKYILRDCDLNCNGYVNIADLSICNSIWRGTMGRNSVSVPCPLR